MPRSSRHVLLLLLLLLLLLTCLASVNAGKQMDGMFSRKLTEPGYYLVTTIPEGAKFINVTELSRTVNFLAIKVQNGTYLFNEDYNISSSGKYEGAGTTFVYIRRNEHNYENFYAAGPLNSSIDVMLIYQQHEPKIFYQYQLPDDLMLTSSLPEKAVTKSLELEGSSTTNFVSTISENLMMRDETRSSTVTPVKKRRRRKFLWSSPGFTNCSKPCGGGFQSKRYICVLQRNPTKQVSNKKCESLDKPKSVTVRCNNSPCAPQWEGGAWSKCSSSCGNGTRTRDLHCIKQMPENLQIRVPDHLCESPAPASIVLKEPCHMPDCDIYTTSRPSLATRQHKERPHWRAEEWSQCSASCGNGTRTRTVTCVTLGKACNMKEKPATEESCTVASCKIEPVAGNEVPEALTDASWLYSEWPQQCSAECGTGTMSRRLFCEKFLKNETCDEAKGPNINRICVSDQICGQWFAGPWTKCSSSCDVGIETREVTCVTKFLGVLKVVQPSNCPGERPETTRLCMSPPCNATWFMSDWTHCSRSCGRGIQKRVVRCVGPDGMPIKASEMECDEERRPASKRHCNDFACNSRSSGKDADSDNDVGEGCRDVLMDCWKVRSGTQESRHKCQIEIYKKGCCKACRYSSFVRANGYHNNVQ